MDLGTSEESADVLALRDRVEQLEAQRAELDRELIRRVYRIGQLEQELQRIEYEFRSSLSWRVMKPLRALKALLGKLRRR